MVEDWWAAFKTFGGGVFDKCCVSVFCARCSRAGTYVTFGSISISVRGAGEPTNGGYGPFSSLSLTKALKEGVGGGS